MNEIGPCERADYPKGTLKKAGHNNAVLIGLTNWTFNYYTA